jgi:branched-chain amino acid transport system ATP-binding protein
MTLLEIQGLYSGYGDVTVLQGVGLTIKAGQIVCLIGSNGAGKTTLLRTISGILRPSAGMISFRGEPLPPGHPQAPVRLGLAHVPEGRRLFAGMTVRENLLIGAYHRSGDRLGIREDLDAAVNIFPRLKERFSQDACTLSGGEQQMCAIARGLMSRPALLMIDEWSLGLAPKVVEEMTAALKRVNQTGLTILVVEQDVATALTFADYGYVLDAGQISKFGPAKELAGDPFIVHAYLGGLDEFTA